jgi:hypothetical protein
MKKIVLVALLFYSAAAFGQHHSIYVIDFVKIKNNNKEQALYFYNNNWKVYRETALKKGYIKSYKLLSAKSDPAADFDLMLLTEYADSAQYKNAENNFNQIIKETRPTGPMLMDKLLPGDFRVNLYTKIAGDAF